MATRFAPSWYKPPAPNTQVPRFGPSWARTVTPGYTPPANAAPAPAAAPAAGPVALPPDGVFEATQAALEKRRSTTLAGLAGQRSRTLSDYGFTEGSYDPSAAGFGSLTVDPNNPWSKASLLKQTYDTNRRSAGQQMGSTGSLYAGAFQNRQDLINRGQLQDEDSLQKSLLRFLAQNTTDYGQAGVDYETGLSQAQADQAARAADSPLYEPAPEAAAPAAAGATKATASVGRPQKTVNGQRFYQRASDKKWIPL